MCMGEKIPAKPLEVDYCVLFSLDMKLYMEQASDMRDKKIRLSPYSPASILPVLYYSVCVQVLIAILVVSVWNCRVR